MSAEIEDLNAIESSVNDASSQVRGIWIAFITFGAYLVIAISSVTHRMLFLETPIRLPALNVDLPLVGFFVAAPIAFLIFYFYTFLQLLALSRKVALYNDTLIRAVPISTERRRRRHRLDPFVFVQFLAGTREERIGFSGVLIRAVAVITVVIGPILLLVQIQLAFLPYHLQSVTWLHRLAIIVGLVLVWCFWPAIRSGEGEIGVPAVHRHWITFSGSTLVAIFSIGIATYPGELLRNGLIAVARPIVVSSDAFFHGAVNEVVGTPRSPFSNILVLPDQQFVDDDMLGKPGKSISLRGRDLRGAVLLRTDLRKADFTGANLNEAILDFAKLSGARFACADTGKRQESEETESAKNSTSPRPATAKWPDDGCAWLQEASLTGVHLEGASLDDAHLDGASLDDANLKGASLRNAHLVGASLDRAELQGAYLFFAHMEAASLDGAELQGAILWRARLRGASLDDAQFQGASLSVANLQGASLQKAAFWRTILSEQSVVLTALNQIDWVSLPINKSDIGRLLRTIALRDKILLGLDDRARGKIEANLEAKGEDILVGLDPDTRVTVSRRIFETWRDEVLTGLDDETHKRVNQRILKLDPDLPVPTGVISKRPFDGNWTSSQTRITYEEKITNLFKEMICRSDNGRFIAHGLLNNGRLSETGDHLPEMVEMLKHPTAKECPGGTGLSQDDFDGLDQMVKDERDARTGPRHDK